MRKSEDPPKRPHFKEMLVKKHIPALGRFLRSVFITGAYFTLRLPLLTLALAPLPSFLPDVEACRHAGNVIVMQSDSPRTVNIDSGGCCRCCSRLLCPLRNCQGRRGKKGSFTARGFFFFFWKGVGVDTKESGSFLRRGFGPRLTTGDRFSHPDIPGGMFPKLVYFTHPSDKASIEKVCKEEAYFFKKTKT